MKVMAYNSLFGGWDGDDDRRHRLQAATIRSAAPDVLLLQEAKHFDQAGSRRLFEVERALGMRAFMAQAPTTGQHTAVFLRPEIEPLAFEPDAAHFHHAAAILTVRVPNVAQAITFASVHLCPLSPHVRLTEVSYLLQLAAPDRLTLVAGDFNSVSPHDEEPSDWAALPRHHRSRYLSPDSRTADRRVLQALHDAGYVDIGHRLGGHRTATVPGAAFKDTEFVPFRSDYLLATVALAEHAAAYSVLRDEHTDAASDHYPIVAEFKL
jgi:endonuclease/exonuclease/phosphatase family metal-dependent hydrolase